MAIIPGIYASQISGHLITSNFFLISQQSPSAVSTITFSSIPATYKSLQVKFNLVTSASCVLLYQFNGDTGSNYAYHALYGNGSAANVTGGATQTSFRAPAQSTLTTYPNVGIVDILDYANTNKNKTVKSLVGANNNTSAGVIEVDSGLWLSTAAITSLVITASTGTFTGTISLYGVS